MPSEAIYAEYVSNEIFFLQYLSQIYYSFTFEFLD